MSSRSPRILNIRLLLITLGVLVVAVPCALFWQRHQVGKQTKAFIERADQLEQEGEFKKAARALQKYVRIKKEAIDEEIRMVELFTKSAETLQEKNEITRYYFTLIGRIKHPEKRLKMRRALIDLLIPLARYVESDREAQKLPKNEKGKLKDPGDMRRAAVSLYGKFVTGWYSSSEGQTKDLAAIGKAVTDALGEDPGNAELASIMVNIVEKQRELLPADLADNPIKRSAMAKQAMEHLLRTKPKDANAWLTYYRYRMRSGLDATVTEADLIKAVQYGANNFDVRKTAGDHYLFAAMRAQAVALNPRTDAATKKKAETQRERFFSEATKHFTKAIDLKPKEAIGYLGLGLVHMNTNEFDKAVKVLQEGIKKVDLSVQLSVNLAEAFLKQDRIEPAEKVMASLDKEFDSQLRKIPPSAALELQSARNFVTAKLHLTRQRIGEAIPLFEDVTRAPAVGMGIQRVLESWYYLGKTFQSLGEFDRAATAFEKILEANPAAQDIKIQCARAWVASGRPGAALKWFADAIRQATEPQQVFQLKLEFATAMWLTRKQNALDVETFEKLVEDVTSEEARKVLKPSWKAIRLQTQYADYQLRDASEDDRKAALKKLLRGYEEKFPVDADLGGELVSLYRRSGLQEEADRVSGTITVKSDATDIEKKLTQAKIMERKGDTKGAQNIVSQLAKGMDSKTSAVESLRVKSDLLRLALVNRNHEEASIILKQLRADDPKNPNWVAFQLELALSAKNFAAAAALEKELSNLPGTEPTKILFMTARRLVSELEQMGEETDFASQSKFKEAAEIAAQIKQIRPHWGPIHIIDGQLRDMAGNRDMAITAYKAAVAYGVPNLAVYERLIFLLYEKGDHVAGLEYLTKMRDIGMKSKSMDDLELFLVSGSGNIDRGLELAEKKAKATTKDSRPWLMYANLLTVKKRYSEASLAMKKAISVDPSRIENWNAYFTFLYGLNRIDDLRDELKRFSREAKTSPFERYFGLGQGLELIGDLTDAQLEFERALQVADTAERKLNAVIYLSRNYAKFEKEKARDLLQKYIKENGRPEQIVRELSSVLSDLGQIDEAIALLKSNKSTPNINLRLMAFYEMRKTDGDPFANMDQARTLLERLKDMGDTTPEDHQTLANIYHIQSKLTTNRGERLRLERKALSEHEALAISSKSPTAQNMQGYMDFLVLQGNAKEARSWADELGLIMVKSKTPTNYGKYISYLLDRGFKQQAALALVEMEPVCANDAHALATYLRLRIRHGSLQDPEKWFTKLEELNNQGDLLAVQIKSEYMRVNGQKSQIPELVEAGARRLMKEATNDTERKRICGLIGTLYMNLEDYGNADIWYRERRKYAPDEYQPLAFVLALRGQHSQAITLCQQGANKSPQALVKSAFVIGRLLTAGQPGEPEIARAEKILLPIINQLRGTQQAQLRNLYAQSLMTAKRTKDAIAQYRLVLKDSPRDFIALNNLAALLAEDPRNSKEALQYIDRAIAFAGVNPQLLDTKGMILLEMGDAEKALPYLETAANAPMPDPRSTFHLAIAQFQMEDKVLAKETLQTAIKNDLAKMFLTKSEQKLLTELKASLLQAP